LLIIWPDVELMDRFGVMAHDFAGNRRIHAGGM